MVMNFAPFVETTLLKSNHGHLAWVVDVIATDCESCAVWFGFFGPYCANELTISNIFAAILWDIVLSYELDRVCRVFHQKTYYVPSRT